MPDKTNRPVPGVSHPSDRSPRTNVNMQFTGDAAVDGYTARRRRPPYPDTPDSVSVELYDKVVENRTNYADEDVDDALHPNTSRRYRY